VRLKCKRSVKLYTIMCVHKLPSSSVVRIMQNDPCVNALFVGAARRCQDKNPGSRWMASNGFCSGDTVLSKTLKGENTCFCSKRMELNLIILNLRGVSCLSFKQTDLISTILLPIKQRLFKVQSRFFEGFTSSKLDL